MNINDRNVVSSKSQPRRLTLLGAALATSALALGCIMPAKDGAPAATPGSAASIGGGTAPAGGTAAAAPGAEAGDALANCETEGLIDDGEDGNNQNLPHGNRGGYWYTFRDKVGTTVEPTAGEEGGTFAMSPGGHASQLAARFHGKVGNGTILFAGMGLNFVDPKGLYDASKATGISFWAKRGENSTGRVRLKVPDANTDPEGGTCREANNECFNDFGYDLNLTPEWRQYVFPWKTLRQLPGWGLRRPAITPSKIYGIQFQVNVPNANYDVYIDDLSFYCK
jgi:hypothetical protein